MVLIFLKPKQGETVMSNKTNDDDKYGKYEDDPKAWLEKINQAHWEQTQAQAKPTTKTVWARISIEVDIDEDIELGEQDDDVLMDTIAEELTQYGFTIDDIGMIDPTDMGKFYEEDK
jgi:hypothetical protein